MADRKVLNKYFPPDWDPRFLAKRQPPKNNQICLRSMLPMTLCCTSCGNYMGRGTKFNSRQEEAPEAMWKGIKVWRFYLKCASCSQEMTFMTDPANDHYVTEHGCVANFEPWRQQIEADAAVKQQKRVKTLSLSLSHSRPYANILKKNAKIGGRRRRRHESIGE